jgi:hypothetical protein
MAMGEKGREGHQKTENDKTELKGESTYKKDNRLWASVSTVALAVFQLRPARKQITGRVRESDGCNRNRCDDTAKQTTPPLPPNPTHTASVDTLDASPSGPRPSAPSSSSTTSCSSTGSATCSAFASAASPWSGSVSPRSPFACAAGTTKRALFAR